MSCPSRALAGLLVALSAASCMSGRPFADFDGGSSSDAPSDRVVVELRGAGLQGRYARDFEVPAAALAAVRNMSADALVDFQLGGPISFRGELVRRGVPDSAYTGPVRIQAVGASQRIPGLRRTYELLLSADEVTAGRGTFEMRLGAGTYTVTATPDDPSVPPATVTGVSPSERAPFVTFEFPAVDGALTISGRLLARADTTASPPQELPLTDVAMDLEAFAPDAGALGPLSQRLPASSGQPGSNGNFSIALHPSANRLKAVLFQASPRTAGAVAPTKRFLVPTPLPNPLVLVLGEVPQALRVAGRVVGADQSAIAGAAVTVSGTTVGGGTYQSAIVLTDATGAFALETLAGPNLTLTAVPPEGSPWALASQAIAVSAQATPSVLVTCGSRVVLRGRVARDDRSSLQRTVVHATVAARAETDPQVLPLPEPDAPVAADGTFSLPLDGASWLLSVVSPDRPIASERVTVSAGHDTSGTAPAPVELAPLTLRAGRGVSGQIVASEPSMTASTAFMSMRFFRVSDVDGSVTLLAETFSDVRGHYRVLLPQP